MATFDPKFASSLIIAMMSADGFIHNLNKPVIFYSNSCYQNANTIYLSQGFSIKSCGERKTNATRDCEQTDLTIAAFERDFQKKSREMNIWGSASPEAGQAKNREKSGKHNVKFG